MTVRTRIPPSPTGQDLHIGNLYTALINWAWAKKHNGQFIVRIEDTDRERFVRGSAEQILETLRMYGLEPDEDMIKGGPYAPYIQSQRLHLYQTYAVQLIDKNSAYYCFCTPERLQMIREEAQKAKKQPKYDRHCLSLSHEEVSTKIKENIPHVVRLKIPEGKTSYRDLIRGNMTIDNFTLDDQVLIKSDGFPTYHLAVVVDDHLMKITHVIRAEEWMASVPKHVIIYHALGWNVPFFAHVPLLRTPEKGKISKRKGAVWASWYLQEGYLPQAVLNYLALMGWSHPEGKEIFSLEEYMKVFDLTDMNPVAPIFDPVKLEWMNGEYIRALSSKNFQFSIFNFHKDKYPKDLIEKTVSLVQERIKTLKEYDTYCRFFIERPQKYEIDVSRYKDLLNETKDELSKLNDWKAKTIGEAMQNVAQKLGVKNSEYFMVVRVAITGRRVTPPLNESMEILGKEECIARISQLTI